MDLWLREPRKRCGEGREKEEEAEERFTFYFLLRVMNVNGAAAVVRKKRRLSFLYTNIYVYIAAHGGLLGKRLFVYSLKEMILFFFFRCWTGMDVFFFFRCCCCCYERSRSAWVAIFFWEREVSRLILAFG